MQTSRPSLDLTRAPILRGVLALAVPVFASQFLETSYNVVNGIWVGRVGTDALAAINASAFFVWLVYSQLGVVSTGTASLVANYVGADRRDDARRVAAQSLVLGLLVAVALSFVGVAVHGAVLRLMGLDAGVVEQGRSYLRLIFLALPMMAVDEVMAAVLRGYGDTRTPTLVWAGVLLVNIGLVPIFVHGYGPVPALGIQGAGVSTAIAMTCGVLAYGVLAWRGRLGFHFGRGDFTQRHFMRDILRIGFPTSFSSVVFCLVYMGLTRVISEFGTAAVAAVGIGHRVESMSYMTCLSFSMAAVTIVGQNKGAGHLDRAARAAWVATTIAALCTLCYSIVMISCGGPLARVFTDDAAVVEAASAYIRIVGFSQVFMALDIVLEGAFSGAGDTVPPMVIAIPLTLARIPAAWYVSQRLGWGLSGVWWVITGLMILRGIVMALWFARGGWKLRAVLRPTDPIEIAGVEDAAAVLHAEMERETR